MITDNNTCVLQLKKLIWLYFGLLLFEGALRKWFLPGLSTPLLIVRDPIALWALIKASQNGLFPQSNYIRITFAVTLLSFMATMLVGHQNLPTAIFGARIFFIHFPFMFLIGKIFTLEDVEKLGVYMLYISIPMVLIIGFQFFSPQSAWINRGIGGDMEGSGFSGAQGYFRPSGVFSFTSGNSMFWSMLVPFLFYNWLSNNKTNFILLVGSTIALLSSIPLTMSRGFLSQIGITLLFSLIAIRTNKKYLQRLILIGIVSFVLVSLLSKNSFLEKGTGAFTERLTTANESEGGVEGVLLERVLGSFTRPISHGFEEPGAGKGLGMGTNVGSKLLSGGVTYLIDEGECGRVIGEMGIFLGLTIILVRFVFVYNLAISSLKKLNQSEEMLSWLLVSAGALMIVIGLYGQPTSLGFSTLYGGLILASLKSRQTDNIDNI